MIQLADKHPARLALGAVRVAAARVDNAVHAGICQDAARFAGQTCEVVAEIATDADYLLDRLQAAVADGVVDAGEALELSNLGREIREQAATGRIISRTA